MTKKTKKPAELKWEYCECGCHGVELRMGAFYRWSVLEFTVPGNYEKFLVHLNDGHKWGKHLGTFNSHAERDKFVRAELKKQIKEMGG